MALCFIVFFFTGGFFTLKKAQFVLGMQLVPAWHAQGPGFNSCAAQSRHGASPALGRKRQKDQEFRVILSSTVNLRPAWATE